MPRIRSIKPEFFASEDVSALPLRARLTWIGLWTQCDDHGRTKRNARLIKASIWPLDDVSLHEIVEDLTVLAGAGRIVTYQVGPTPLLAVVNWHVHQSINRMGRPRYPGPPAPIGVLDPADPHYCEQCALPGPAPAEQYASEPRGSGSSPVELTADSVNGHPPRTPGKEGKGKEGRGRAREAGDEPGDPQPPPRQCPTHANDPDPPPCGGCADARRANESWHRERNRADAQRRSAEAKANAEAKSVAIRRCGLCDEHGYRDGRVCDHDPTSDSRAKRGIAEARAAIKPKGAAA